VVDETTQDHGQLCWAHDWLASEFTIEQVPTASLVQGDSPRLDGLSKRHAALMLDFIDMPPIIVHRPTMHVIDGAHRLKAATQRHQDTIDVRFFDGTAEEAFIIAVAANIKHGLPLSPRDRKAAAARILDMYPKWSDRAIAATAGLSHHTVAAIRRTCPTGQTAQSDTRLGRDGKTRPLTADEGRRVAAELIRANQSKSLREIAREAHVSRGTAHDVRARLNQGVDPLVATSRAVSLTVGLARAEAALKRLWNDPAARSHQNSKIMLQLLAHCLHITKEAHAACKNAPEHCLDTFAEFASALGDAWSRLAQELHTRANKAS
jgi:ParB-like nuclease domain